MIFNGFMVYDKINKYRKGLKQYMKKSTFNHNHNLHCLHCLYVLYIHKYFPPQSAIPLSLSLSYLHYLSIILSFPSNAPSPFP